MTAPASRLPRPSPGGAPLQALLFLFAYLVYGGSRWIAIGDRAQALAHAHWVVRHERMLGLAVEAPIQRALQGTPALWPLDHAYLAAQAVVVPGALIWLYRRDPVVYRLLRNTVLATWLLALPVFWLFPVAPPRLAGIGIVDTITRQTGLALNSRLATSFYNPLAAVPSLHCGFALAVSLAGARGARRWWTRALALAWAPTIFLAVVATGNHFVFDVVTGVATTGLGFAASQLAAVAARRRRGHIRAADFDIAVRPRCGDAPRSRSRRRSASWPCTRPDTLLPRQSRSSG